jgi:hypothetical protein
MLLAYDIISGVAGPSNVSASGIKVNAEAIKGVAY